MVIGLAVVTVSLAAAVARQRSARHAKSPSDLDRIQGRWVATTDGLEVIMTVSFRRAKGNKGFCGRNDVLLCSAANTRAAYPGPAGIIEQSSKGDRLCVSSSRESRSTA
jgi:hypothetical protein